MTLFLIIAGLMSAAYFWRLGWFLVQAAAWPVVLGAAWCFGAVMGLPDRWKRWKRKRQAAKAVKLNAKNETHKQ